MNKHILLLLLLPLASFCRADRDTTPGWLTDMLNQSLERAVGRKGDSATSDSLCYGRNETRFASVPKFGGYLVGQYQYFSQAGAHGGPGFSARYIRAYVSGTLLRDFSYYVQMELKGKPGLRDYTISWQRWPELRVTLGQTDRFFTFESPMSLWKVGGWDYSQMVNNLNGAGDYCGEPNMNARDQGLILQGDVLPLGAKGLRRLRYTAAVYNGNGINQGDNNRRKDLVGNLQVQLAEDLWLGIFGWKGTFTQDGITVGRNRWSTGLNYEHEGWTARAEYAHNTGHRISDYQSASGLWTGTGRADAWVVTAGVPLTRWLKAYLIYDAYRSQATFSTMRTAYNAALSIQLHRNLLFKLHYAFIDDRPSPVDRYYSELSAQAYIRF